MSLTGPASSVTASDIQALQAGMEAFTNSAEATAFAAQVNAGATTVAAIAQQYFQNNTALTVAAMLDDSLMQGGVPTAGPLLNPSSVKNELQQLTNPLPSSIVGAAQAGINLALKIGTNQVTTAAEVIAVGVAAGDGTQNNFLTSFGALTVSQFATTASTAIFGNSTLASAITGYVNNWLSFYNGVGKGAIQAGLTATTQSYAAAFGDAVGLYIQNTATFGTVNSGLTFNALVDNALVIDGVTGAAYAAGTQLSLQAVPQQLQGGTTNTFTLTQNIDAGAAFTTATPGAIYNALPFVTPLGLANNTLNTGDSLTDSAKDGTLNFVTTAGGIIGANPPFATGVSMTGIKTLNITGNSTGTNGFTGGAAGGITGLLVENNNGSVGAVDLGSTGQGLKTLLTDINISNYGGTADDMNTVVLAASAGDATKTINVSISGTNTGSTAAGGAMELAISNDVGGGTAAAPNLTYGTWAVTINNTSNLQLEQSVTVSGTGANTSEGGVGGATGLVLKGSGNMAFGQAVVADWQLLQKIDSSAATGNVRITGATSFAGTTNAFFTTANPNWLFGSDAGLLDDTGASFAVNNIVLGSGMTIIDASSASATNIGKLTTAAGTGVTVNAGDELIVKDSVATTTSTSTFATIAGFGTLGIGGPTGADGAGGTISQVNLPTSITTLDYVTTSSGALTINQTAALTVNTEDNGAGNAITVKGPSGLKDSFALSIGDTFHSTAGAVGNLTLTGDEIVSINSVGAKTNTLGYVSLTPSAGGDETVTISGNKDITIGATGSGAIADVDAGNALIFNNMVITITNTGVTRFLSSSNNGTNPPLDLPILGDPTDASGGTTATGFPLTNSTNARLIDASASGGLIMNGGDANYIPSATIAGSQGSVLIGSTTGGNVLGGSIGTDTITVANTVSNTVFTGGGAGTITLGAGHTATNSIDIYSGFSTTGVTPGTAEIVRFVSITNSHDIAELGWFGQPTGITATGYDATGNVYAGLGANIATAATATVISGFSAAGPGVATPDIIQLSDGGSGYGTGGLNGFGGTALGLVAGNFTNPIAAGANGTAVVTQNISGNFFGVNVAANTVNATTTLIELTGQTFLSVQSVVDYLKNPATNVHFGAAALPAADSAHIYVAWQDASGNTDIGDLALIANAGASADTFTMTMHLSELVQLVGVPLASVTGADVHLMHN